MFHRPTALAAAFVNAAVLQQGISVDKGTGNWIARRTLLNTERPGFGIVKEVDRSPRKPGMDKAEMNEAIQSFTHNPALDAATQNIISETIFSVAEHLVLGRPFLTDEEILGVD